MPRQTLSGLVRFSLLLPADHMAALQALAAQNGDPVAALVRLWIRERLEWEARGDG